MSIEDLIDNISVQDYVKAEPAFNELLHAKMNDALEAEKIKVAGQIFNGDEPDDEQLELDLEDEDIDIEDEEDTEE